LLASNKTQENCLLSLSGHPAYNPSQRHMLPAQTSVAVKNLKAQRLPIVASSDCPAHSGLKSYVSVFTDPYFAVTDADGGFEIKPAPAGESRLMIWHETGWIGGVKGKDGRKVSITPKDATNLGAINWELP
jgi:hypothetical protein